MQHDLVNKNVNKQPILTEKQNSNNFNMQHNFKNGNSYHKQPKPFQKSQKFSSFQNKPSKQTFKCANNFQSKPNLFQNFQKQIKSIPKYFSSPKSKQSSNFQKRPYFYPNTNEIKQKASIPTHNRFDALSNLTDTDTSGNTSYRKNWSNYHKGHLSFAREYFTAMQPNKTVYSTNKNQQKNKQKATPLPSKKRLRFNKSVQVQEYFPDQAICEGDLNKYSHASPESGSSHDNGTKKPKSILKPSPIEVKPTTNMLDVWNRHALLPFIDVMVGGTPGTGLKLRALSDTGATHCMMPLDKFIQIPDYQSIKKKDHGGTYSGAMSDGLGKILYIAELYLTLYDMDQRKVCLPTPVFITKDGSLDFLFGSDILGSYRKVYETPNYVTLTGNPNSHKFFDPPQHKDWFKIPIRHDKCDKANPDRPIRMQKCLGEQQMRDRMEEKQKRIRSNFLTLQNDVTLPAMSPATVMAKPERKVFHQKAMACEPLYSTTDFEIIPTCFNANVKGKYPTTILNQNDFEIELKAGTRIGTFKEVDMSDVSIVSATALLNQFSDDLDLKGQDFHAFTTNIRAKQQAEDMLNSDEGYDNDERAQQLQKLDEDGFYQHSVSHQIDNFSRIKEHSAKEESPLTDEQLLSNLKLEHLDSATANLIKRAITPHLDVFSRHEYDITKTHLTEAKITLKNELKTSVNCKYIPVPPQARDEVMRILQKLLDAGILRYCNNEDTPIISNLIITKKKDGSIRILEDCRLINMHAVKLPCSMPTQTEILDHLRDATMVSTIDLSNSFYAIPISEESQHLTAFYSPSRDKLCYQSLPQGYLNSAGHLSACMLEVLKGIPQALSYMDDILIASSGGLEEHIDILIKVLQSLKDANIKIKPAKVQACREVIDFLGIHWDKQRFSIPKSRIQALLDMKTPRSIKELKSVIMSASFYRRFIYKFSEICLPLTKLSRQDHRSKFIWDEECQQAFDKLKEAIANSMTLYTPDPNKTFYCSSDASSQACSFTLWQYDNDNNARYIGNYSKTFSKTERNWNIFRKETASVLAGQKCFDFYLRYAKDIVCYIDAKALLFLRMCKNSCPMLVRFSLAISSYNISIRHISGKDNLLADLNSRYNKHIGQCANDGSDCDLMSEDEAIKILNKLRIPSETYFTQQEVKEMLDCPSYPSLYDTVNPKKKKYKQGSRINISPSNLVDPLMREKKIKVPKTSKIHAFEKDRHRPRSYCCITANAGMVCSHNQDNLEHLELNTSLLRDGQLSVEQFSHAQRLDPTLSEYFDKPPREYFVRKGLLMHKAQGIEKIALPDNLLEPLLFTLHFTLLGKHNSKTSIIKTISEKYFCKDLDSKVDKYLSTCYYCQVNKLDNKPKHTVGKSISYSAPRQAYYFDIACGLPTSNQCRYVYLWVCSFSQYLIACPAKSRDAKEITAAFKNSVLKPFMTPYMIHSDAEPGILSNDFSSLLSDLQIEHNPTAAHSPESNSQAELKVKAIKNSLRNYCHQTGHQWTKDFYLLVMAHNMTKNSYGYTPEELFYGNASSNHKEILEDFKPYKSIDEYLQAVKENHAKISKIMTDRRAKANNNSREYQNRTRKQVTFEEGDLVLCRDLTMAEIEGGALKAKFKGPMIITELNSDGNTCKIQDLNTDAVKKAHFKHLKHFTGQPLNITLHNDWDANITSNLRNQNQNRPKQTVNHRPHTRSMSKQSK